MKIVVNGGHCPGLDCGAVGNRLEEAEVCRELMEMVGGYLESAGLEILLMQQNELADIVGASNSSGADLFVSIHCNAAENPVAQGTETYFCSDEGRILAGFVQHQVVDSLGTVDRGVTDGRWLYVLRNTEAIGILVETAFISNAADAALLTERRVDFARAIARGITDYEADCRKE